MLPVGLLTTIASPWRIAYVARVYYPAGDKRVSHHQVYLSDLRGRRVRRITTGGYECRVVRWLDRATIAWTRDDGTLWRMRVDGDSPRLWKRTKVDWIDDSLPNELRQPGPIFPLDRLYRYVGGRLRPEATENPSREWVGAAAGCDVHPKDEEGTLVGSKGELHLQPIPEATEMERPATTFSGPGKDDLWVVYTAHLSSWGAYYSLVRYDRSTGKALWKRGETEDFDFRLDRTLYARTTVRRTATRGKLQLWTAAAYVGDWRTNREWKLTTGFVEAWSVSLRP